MPRFWRLDASTPPSRSAKPCTKCLRPCSPSVTVSIPARTCSPTAMRTASRCASSRSPPSRRHAGKMRSGSASQAGLGRLPAIVVGNGMARSSLRDSRGPVRKYAASMRLDKFMKVSRLAKRRAEAKDGIEAGRGTQDGRRLKPGYDVKVGDVLLIHYRTKFLTVRVLLVPERVLPSLKPADMYEIVDERKDDPVDWLG